MHIIISPFIAKALELVHSLIDIWILFKAASTGAQAFLLAIQEMFVGEVYSNAGIKASLYDETVDLMGHLLVL